VSSPGGGELLIERQPRPVVHLDRRIPQQAKRVLTELVRNKENFLFSHGQES
jgi:hypothetical protein